MRCTLSLAICALGAALALATPLQAQDNAGASQSSAGAVASGATAKTVGVMKSISGNSLVLKSDAGPEITITVADGARLLRMAPGQTDLKSAATITLADLQVGDRMLVRGRAADNGAITASTIVVMKQADVAQKQLDDRGGANVLHTVGVLRPADGVADGARALAAGVAA